MQALRKKILVIDDMPANNYVLQQRLEEEGFEVNTSTNGLLGLQIALSDEPDLIICDIMMPGMDGYKVMNQLKGNPKTALIPFIFLTAKSDNSDIREGMKLGADDFLIKPYNHQDLLNTINMRLQKIELQEKRIETLRRSISYSLPHELLTPLTSILGFNELLINDYNKMPRQEILEIALNMQDSAKRLNELIQNILYTTRLDFILRDFRHVKELRNNLTLVSSKLVKDIALDLAKSFKRQDDIVVNINSASLKISREHFKKLISEVLDNAIKFSKKGTKVLINSLSTGDNYVLHITDHGFGMTEEQISLIGEFIQFDRILFERKGTGLGLSIVKKLVEIYNGRLSINSIPSKQTLVSIQLPISKEEIN
jgi:two-component system, sensor histidine kinase and response regulator